MVCDSDHYYYSDFSFGMVVPHLLETPHGDISLATDYFPSTVEF
ncbi:MAG: hypothetical protein NTY95_14560 [Bacteroidia bacterium]|nr:hypothetical protein [Bacteroidia bacterium]